MQLVLFPLYLSFILICSKYVTEYNQIPLMTRLILYHRWWVILFEYFGFLQKIVRRFFIILNVNRILKCKGTMMMVVMGIMITSRAGFNWHKLNLDYCRPNYFVSQYYLVDITSLILWNIFSLLWFFQVTIIFHGQLQKTETILMLLQLLLYFCSFLVGAILS